MTGWKPALILSCLAAISVAQDLPLPQSGPPPGSETLVKPTVIAKPPVSGPVAAPKDESAPELALKAMEQALIEEQARKQVADAAKKGDTAALKQLIVMAGPVDAALLKSARPPVAPEGKVALIGIDGQARIGKSLDQFFGAPLTPEKEKQILDTVKSQLADGQSAGLEVKVAGWWPAEGVMAVTLVPRS